LRQLDLLLLDAELALCRLEPGDRLPDWADGELVATVRTRDELSVVCEASAAPVNASGSWRALRVAGTLDLSLTGVLLALVAPLEEAGIPIFAISSYDTDYVLVPGNQLDQAVSTLREAGHRLH